MFSGLSIEYNELAHYEAAGPLFDRVLTLLRPLDGEPMLVRIGGKSADDTYWQTATTNAPSWVFEIGKDWLTALAALARRDGLRVMLDLNLAVHSQTMAIRFAQAARSALPGSGLAALGIGNEPDLFGHQPGLEKERTQTTTASTLRHWVRGYSPSRFRRDYEAYARSLLRAAPGIPLSGPEVASSKREWLTALGGLRKLAPRIITIHRYAASTCWPRTSPYFPTIRSLLSEASTAGLAQSLRGAMAFARAAPAALRVTEFNSVSCGGNHGVTDSFATALWAPDALFEMIRAGVTGVNWHIRPYTVNAPFHIAPDGLQPEPSLYGLALFGQMIGPHARLITVRTAGSHLHLKAWAVRSQTGLNVLLINKGSQAVNVQLRPGAGDGPALVRRLIAPSISSRSGITLGGQWIGPDANWRGDEAQAILPPVNGAYRLLVPGYSAALVTLGSSAEG